MSQVNTKEQDDPNTQSSWLYRTLFCGEKCDIKKDLKYPIIWRSAYVYRQGETVGRKSIKEVILKVCDARMDSHSEQVRVRLTGIPSDLHAEDIRYHVDCRTTFIPPSSIEAAAACEKMLANAEPIDAAFLCYQ